MSNRSVGARSRARDLAVQALYQKQISDHSLPELLAQFQASDDYEHVDQEYFDESLSAICRDTESLKQRIDEIADRPVGQLDPVELSILLLGVYEFESRSDIPYRVVINEAVNLCKKFGSVDGHKYVNAVLDRAAATMRPTEAR
jgi:N utilization substance protein B